MVTLWWILVDTALFRRKATTISDGMIWHLVPPAVMHWEEHSTIFWVLARNTWLESCHEETSDGSKLSMTQVTLENKKFWLFKTVKDETVMERQKSCSRLKETHDCYVRRWLCFGKYILELQDWTGLISVYNLLSNGLEKHWRLNNWVSRRRENRNSFYCASSQFLWAWNYFKIDYLLKL